MDVKQPNLVHQYYAQVFDDTGIFTINCGSLPDCQKKVRLAFTLLDPHFVENKDSNTLTIYSGGGANAKAIGWMTEIEVPEGLTVRRVTETLLRQAA